LRILLPCDSVPEKDESSWLLKVSCLQQDKRTVLCY
jgi:hypothetical protein